MRTAAGAWATALAAVLAAALSLSGAGCDSVDIGAIPTASAGPGSAAGPAPRAPANTAAAGQLAALKVAVAASMRGYSRDRFPHWRSTGTNCDVRDSVLRRDGKQIRLRGCNVVGGSWFSRYDGKTFTDPKDVDIDHMVPLANAWRSGANAWDDKRRGDFANDLTRPQLIAVSLSTNRAKGDQDPAQWKPPDRAYWCRYAQDWIAVKHYWRLTVTTAEKAALGDMVKTC